jgi:transaldolase
MQHNPLQRLAKLGQSVWLDDIRRAWLEDGTIARLIEHDGVSGLTSNPAIFACARLTYEEFRGLHASSCWQELAARHAVSGELTILGLDPDALGEQLQCEGVRKFRTAYQQLLATLDRRIKVPQVTA